MIEHSLRGRQLTFSVQVVPRASRTEVVGEHGGALRVKISAPPVDGAANDKLVRLLAKTFRVSRSSIEIVSGQTARVKLVRIDGGRAEILESFFNPD